MVIQQGVAIETLKLLKWNLGVLLIIISITILLPGLFPHVKNASIGSLKIEFVQKQIAEVERNRGDIFKGTPEELQKLLIKKGSSLKNKRILWYDDIPSNNTAIRHLFEEVGVRFDVVTSNDRANLQLRIKRYDAVISDSSRIRGYTGRKESAAVVKQFKEWQKNIELPPWFFYSSSLDGNEVEGAALSTTSPYVLITALVDQLSDKSSSNTQNSIPTKLSVPWWFFVLSLILLIICIISIFLIVLSSQHIEKADN